MALSVSILDFGGSIIFKDCTIGVIAPVLSGGVSYFIGKLHINTRVGYAITWTHDNMRYIDYVIIPANIDASINGIGVNVGGGADIFFTPNVGINIDARYFIKSEDEYLWEIAGGSYKSQIHTVSLTINQDVAEALSKEWVPAFELNPSFFKFSVGLVIRF